MESRREWKDGSEWDEREWEDGREWVWEVEGSGVGGVREREVEGSG